MTLLTVAKVLSTISLICMLLGPIPDTIQIIKTRSTGVMPLLPLVTLIVNSWMLSIYGILAKAIFPVAFCNIVGVVLSSTYTAVFYWITTEKRYARKRIGIAIVLIVLLTIYAAVASTKESRHSVKTVFGYISGCTLLCFFAASFENVAQVIKYRSGVFIPIVLVLAGAVNAALWVFYGALVPDWFILVPNAGGFAMAAVQITLYVVFHPSTHPYNAPQEPNEKDLEASSPAFMAFQSPK